MTGRTSIGVVLLLLAAPAVLAQPKIRVVPSALLELGDLYTGQQIQRTVTIRNDGTDTLLISDVKPSCGCTSALLQNDKRSLGPSDTVELTLTFDTQDRAGGVVKSVDVYSNDSTNSKLSILFSAYIIERLKISPPRINLYIQRTDSVYKEIVRLKNQGKDRALNFLSADTKLQNLTLRLMKSILAPGEETQLELTYRPAKAADARGIIELTTDHPLQNKFFIEVYTWAR
jgi:hypothetical protein